MSILFRTLLFTHYTLRQRDADVNRVSPYLSQLSLWLDCKLKGLSNVCDSRHSLCHRHQLTSGGSVFNLLVHNTTFSLPSLLVCKTWVRLFILSFSFAGHPETPVKRDKYGNTVGKVSGPYREGESLTNLRSQRRYVLHICKQGQTKLED